MFVARHLYDVGGSEESECPRAMVEVAESKDVV